MTSASLIRAAQTNGSKSRGPKTAEGKRRSSANSRRHGLYSKNLQTDAECEAEYQHLFAALLDEFQPASPFEGSLVHTVALSIARCRWARRMMVATLNAETDASPNPEAPLLTRLCRAMDAAAGPLEILHRMEQRFHRQSQEALDSLREMKSRAKSKTKERTDLNPSAPRPGRAMNAAAGPPEILHRMERRFHRQSQEALESLREMKSRAKPEMKERTESPNKIFRNEPDSPIPGPGPGIRTPSPKNFLTERTDSNPPASCPVPAYRQIGAHA